MMQLSEFFWKLMLQLNLFTLFTCRDTRNPRLPLQDQSLEVQSKFVSTDKNDHLSENNSLQSALVKMTSRVVCNKNRSIGRLIVQNKFCARPPFFKC